MKLQQLHSFLSKVWADVVEMSEACKRVDVYEDRIEGIKD